MARKDHLHSAAPGQEEADNSQIQAGKNHKRLDCLPASDMHCNDLTC